MRKILFLLTFIVLTVFVNGQYAGFTAASQGGAAAAVNVISNGTFDSADDWTVSQITISGGVATTVDNGIRSLTQAQADMISGMENSTAYTFKITVSAVSYVYIQTASTNVDYVSGFSELAIGVNTLQFTSPANTVADGGGLALVFLGTNIFTIDDIILTKD